MTRTLDDDRDLRRYLLGALPEADMDRLEARLLADGDLYHAVLAAEDDLVDDYAAGRLPDGEHRAFEDRLLPLPGMSRRIAFARTLERVLEAEGGEETGVDGVSERTTVAASAASLAGRPLPWRERLGGWFGGLLGDPAKGGFPAGLRLAAAGAAALLLVTATWLAWQNVQLDQRVAELEAQRAALSREQSALQTTLEEREARLAGELAEARAAAGDGTASAGELQTARQRIDELEGELSELRRKRPPRRVAVSFLLTLATRGAGVPELAVPAAADAVELQLDTAGDEAVFDAFRVRVLGPTGAEVWSRTGLAARPATGTVDVELPAEALVPGRHEVLLEGLGADGPRLVGAYEIELTRP